MLAVSGTRQQQQHVSGSCGPSAQLKQADRLVLSVFSWRHLLDRILSQHAGRGDRPASPCCTSNGSNGSARGPRPCGQCNWQSATNAATPKELSRPLLGHHCLRDMWGVGNRWQCPARVEQQPCCKPRTQHSAAVRTLVGRLLQQLLRCTCLAWAAPGGPTKRNKTLAACQILLARIQLGTNGATACRLCWLQHAPCAATRCTGPRKRA